MIELNPNTSLCPDLFNRTHSANDHADLFYRAMYLFNAALSRGRFARLKRLITHNTGQLCDLNNVPGIHKRAQYYGGLHAVALKKICGSLGRTGDFDYDFNPLDTRSRERWQSIAIACLQNTGLKPVDLIQVEDSYFVQDGHHRVSVARALGQLAIDAEVTVWVVPQSLPIAAILYAKPQVQMNQTML